MILERKRLNITLVLISMIMIFGVKNLTLQNLKMNNKYDFKDESRSSQAPKPMNGCIYFYDACNYEGNLIIKLCHWKLTSVPKLITEAVNPKIKNIKSISFSDQTKLYMDYDINRIPQKKITFEKNVACISDIFKGYEDYKITILEANYSGI